MSCVTRARLCYMTGPEKERRVYVPVRLGTNGLRYIDAQAQAHSLTRSEMIRRLLAEGIKIWQKKTGDRS